MKKLITLLLCAALLLGLAACAGQEEISRWGNGPHLLTVLADEEEVSRNVVARLYERIDAFGADALNLGLSWRQPDRPTREDRLRLVTESVEEGARVLVCVGSAYETVVYDMQARYPEVMFLLLDGEPRGEAAAVYESLPNTHCILFQEAEAGFLAGYAAVTEGAQKLGFCGGGNGADMIRYAYGFLQGADYAAAKRGLAPGDVLLRFWYAEEEDLAEDARLQLEQWQQVEGLDLVLACEGETLAITDEILDAAGELGVSVIAEGNRSLGETATLLCSIEKDYSAAAQEALLRLAENGGLWDKEQAGQTLTLGAGDYLRLAGQGESWPFTQLRQADYAALVNQLARGEIVVEQRGNPELLPVFSICIVTE